MPTLLLIIGYPIFWLEVYAFNRGYGKTTFLAPVVFLGTFVLLIICQYQQIDKGVKKAYLNFTQLSFLWRIFFIFAGIIVGIILLCGLHASLLPPHLIQETDALNYHITLPRQHLIMQSFSHIPWSLADLYFLPLNFALAPYWLTTTLPNKFPQFLFLIGLISVSVKLTHIFSKNSFVSMCCIVFALVGSHNVGIQMGTAMLDVAICYLLLASLDSFLEGDVWLCAVELAFYFWSKSFIPIQMTLIFLLLGGLYIFLNKFGFKDIVWTMQEVGKTGKVVSGRSVKKVFVCFLFLSLFIGGPFIWKSLYYAQTPLFPFFSGSVPLNQSIDKNSTAWKSMIENAEKAVATRDQYGSGRSLVEFMKHFWLIAVPEKGVNNRYDYPVGLMYLLCLGPFFYILVQSLLKRQFAIVPLFIAVYWVLWWMGTHQTRFLFIPIILMYIVVLSRPQFITTTFMVCVILSLGLTSISVLRAHKSDFGKSSYEVLRSRDQYLVGMSKTVDRAQPVQIDFADAAFADFSIDVRGEDSVFIIKP